MVSRVAKTVSFTEDMVRRVEHHMEQNNISSFSSAVQQLLSKALPPLPEELRKALLEEYQAQRRAQRQERLARESVASSADIAVAESCPNCGSRDGFVRFSEEKARCDMCLWYSE
jgi:DNA-binding helix-hairpin-helix protein with protein kinase domain